VQEAELGLAMQLREHPGHGAHDRQPLVDGQRPVDAHADEEDDEVAVQVCREALRVDHRLP
jgi:hypothetical protein